MNRKARYFLLLGRMKALRQRCPFDLRAGWYGSLKAMRAHPTRPVYLLRNLAERTRL